MKSFESLMLKHMKEADSLKGQLDYIKKRVGFETSEMEILVDSMEESENKEFLQYFINNIKQALKK
jgi:uncharacterized protein YfkK (UPF0435 family)